MNPSRRAVITAWAVVATFLGSVGTANAAIHLTKDGCIPLNDHSSTDLYRYPQCPGQRDIRDDADGHGGRPGPEDRGPLGNALTGR